MSQEIHLNREVPDSEFINFIDFERNRWDEGTLVWVERRYRNMPLPGYNTKYPRIDRFSDNINTKNPVFYRK